MREFREVVAVGVALLAEGVDRNVSGFMDGLDFDVALLAEGVDRNWKYAMDILVR